MAEGWDEGKEAIEERTVSVAGFPFPASPAFPVELIQKALTYRPQPNDVILSSYPKCDSKYVEIILWKLLYPSLNLPSVNAATNRHLSCIEMPNMIDYLTEINEHIAKHKLPRLLKTYLPFQLIPFYKRAKYIYVIRAPWKACASYYKFLLSLDSIAESFEEFFEAFLEGNVAYGCFFKHVSPWKRRLNESNVLILCHEHVKHNPRSAVFTIAAFLGDGHLKRLLNCEEMEKSILKSTNWDHCRGLKQTFKTSLPLKKDLDTIHCYNDLLTQVQNESKTSCSEEQIKRIIEKISDKFKGSSVEHLWLSLLKTIM